MLVDLMKNGGDRQTGLTAVLILMDKGIQLFQGKILQVIQRIDAGDPIPEKLIVVGLAGCNAVQIGLIHNQGQKTEINIFYYVDLGISHIADIRRKIADHEFQPGTIPILQFFFKRFEQAILHPINHRTFGTPVSGDGDARGIKNLLKRQGVLCIGFIDLIDIFYSISDPDGNVAPLF